jgi:GT2 family glycosyltransferase
MRPDISVVIPAYREGVRLAGTIESIAATRTTDAVVEVVIADDASENDTEAHLRAAWPRLARHDDLHVRLSRLANRTGVPRTRNYAAGLAGADILFITDAHVRFPPGWDALIHKHMRNDRILAGVITEANTPFKGFGCQLVVPFMGTYWNRDPVTRPREVQIASSAATIVSRSMFRRLGGYDEGMIMYGGAEPEFSVRAWLSGAKIVLVPELAVEHRFKPARERGAFISEMRMHMVCNSIRFGLLYCSERGAMQMLRYYALKFPNLFEQALSTVAASDVWDRRDYLESRLRRDFAWFVRHFGIKDHLGDELP